ncbi:hypothetical protein A2U01_0112332 [Trifolium medium]|uniref:Uncharacterized protein n=1 Tax=Trifolium medium TaxID=97028 RepID=A0A392VRL5_9FABA|nr:hypothetical protein [Trifolium medium]
MEPRRQVCLGQDQAEFLQYLFEESDPRLVDYLVEPGSHFL